MTPYYADDWLTILQGDVREVLPTLPADSVDCIVTSPPFWGLRDYGHADQIGLERTPEEYVANLVGVFRELRRVLKPSGTCWLNLGDSYASSGQSDPTGFERLHRFEDRTPGPKTAAAKGRAPSAGLKPKDLVGIPWRVAFALQADGWYLRSDIIWSKPNPMPESVTDRPTKSHEYLFLLTRSPRYFFDADAVREAGQEWNGRAGTFARNGAVADHIIPNQSAAEHRADRTDRVPAGRNLRSVWTIATRPYPGAHFAVFPPELPERCIKAGSSERGVCPECGAPWERVVEREPGFESRRQDEDGLRGRRTGGSTNGYRGVGITRQETTGWQPSCVCLENRLRTSGVSLDGTLGHSKKPGRLVRTERRNAVTGTDSTPPPSVPAVVLDPFAGSGTTGMVANRLSRRAILIDLNGDYLKQQMKRNAQTPLGLGAA